MKRRYAELTRTGSRGPLNKIEEMIKKVMVDEVDTVGDTVGSSGQSGFEVRGENIFRNTVFCQLMNSILADKCSNCKSS